MTWTFAVVLVVAAALVMAGGRLASRLGRSPRAGKIWTLVFICVAAALTPVEWRTWAVGQIDQSGWPHYIRGAGLVTLLFLSGLKFDHAEVFGARRQFIPLAASHLALIGLLALAGVAFLNSDVTSAAIVASAMVATSLVLPLETRRFEDGPLLSGAAAGAALTIGGFALGIAWAHWVAREAQAAQVTVWGPAFIWVYELLKLLVFFAGGYFLLSRFVRRGSGKVSPARLSAGYLLISALLYVLAVLALGQSAAFALVFLAGTVFAVSSFAERIRQQEASSLIGIAMLAVFLPSVLASGGRTVSEIPWAWWLLAPTVLGAKFAASWAGERIAGEPPSRASRLALASLPGGETGMVVLSVAVVQWPIDSPLYFSVLSASLLSMALSESAPGTKEA